VQPHALLAWTRGEWGGEVKDAIASVVSTALVLLAIVGALLLSGLIGCHRVVEYPRAAACPVLATLPTGEVVDVPREPSCPLPGPRPTVLTAKTLELGDVLQADALNLAASWIWMEEADLYIGCVNALPGEP
jgi:hypothetical protein